MWTSISEASDAPVKCYYTSSLAIKTKYSQRGVELPLGWVITKKTQSKVAQQ
jgi:hypothetical protein